MGRLSGEARMTIKVLNERGATGAEIAGLLGVSENGSAKVFHGSGGIVLLRAE